jgi:RimJ/RimL family protein N-acetyltransferase
MSLPTLGTDRLVLREMAESDADGLHAAFGNADAMRFWNSPPTRTVADTALLIKKALTGRRIGHGVWAILRRDGPFVGMINYHHREVKNQRLELGWIVVPAYWRQGIMTEAASAILGHCFGTMKMHRVEALIEPENLSSLALAAKLGFVNEGLLRDRLLVSGGFRNVQMHALLKPEWHTPAVKPESQAATSMTSSETISSGSPR